MTPKTSIIMHLIGGPQSTQRSPKLTRIHVLEVQNHPLTLNAITQKLPKYHHGYIGDIFSLQKVLPYGLWYDGICPHLSICIFFLIYPKRTFVRITAFS